MNIRKKISENKYIVFYCILFGCLPLIFVDHTNELFEFPKTFFIYAMALILAVLVSYDFLLKDKAVIFKPIPMPVLFYLLMLIVSSLFSSHLYTSVFGYYTRFFGGIASVLCVMFFYYVGRSVLDKPAVDKIISVIALTIIPISIFGILQYTDLLGIYTWLGDDIQRVYSTFGQPNWLAQYLVMVLPWVFYYYLGEIKPYFWGIVYLLGYACLWFTFSMSGFIGYFVSLIVLFIILFSKKRSGAMYKKAFILMFLCAMVSAMFPGMFKDRLHDFYKDAFGHRPPVVLSVYAQERENKPISEKSDYKVSDPGFIRLGLWKGTVDLILSSPKAFLIGTGPETFPYTFQHFRTKDLNYSSEWNFIFNKPHNYYLQLWAETGLLGLSAYLILLGYLIKKASYLTVPAVVGFVVSNIFGWPTAAATALFWYWFVIIEVESKEEANG